MKLFLYWVNSGVPYHEATVVIAEDRRDARGIIERKVQECAGLQDPGPTAALLRVRLETLLGFLDGDGNSTLARLLVSEHEIARGIAFLTP